MPASARGRVNPINWIYSYILKMKVIKCDWAESMQCTSTYKYLNVNIYKYIIIILLPWSEGHGNLHYVVACHSVYLWALVMKL
jgi:hypothetical protein